jgi:hypothetical protein
MCSIYIYIFIDVHVPIRIVHALIMVGCIVAAVELAAAEIAVGVG